ncbi:hypothetical protein [Halomicronema sp. CCY15110]|uniref:hypothetical protein n=1 Tax=Halomicronema sp. CCY15110 TaxID=2767773 RepID=UPI00194F69CE|nr:hypothetical protein [Halomicronema sp. CCY15110]
MTPTPKDFQQNSESSQRVNSTGVSSVVISLITGPFLATLMGARTLAEALEQVGIVSEEIFRGVRLPSLPDVPTARDRGMDDTDNDDAENS